MIETLINTGQSPHLYAYQNDDQENNKIAINMPGCSISNWIEKLSHTFNDIDAQAVMICINEARSIAGFPEITDLSIIEVEIQARRYSYVQTIKNALNKIQSTDLIALLHAQINFETAQGSKQAPILIDDLIESYEIAVQNFLQNEQDNVLYLIKKIEELLQKKSPIYIINLIIDQLITVIRNWVMVAAPIQINKKSLGLTHEPSLKLALNIRQLAQELSNTYRKSILAQSLINLIQELFSGIDIIIELITEDKKHS